MAYLPFPGSGATLEVDSVEADVIDMEITLQRKEVETTRTSDIYRTYIAGRYGGTLTVTLAGSGDSSSVTRQIVANYLSQSSRGTVATFVLTDAGSSAASGTSQTYTFDGIIQNAVQSTRQDEQDTVRLEVIITGQIT